jgi:phosphohistidine phosphatase
MAMRVDQHSHLELRGVIWFLRHGEAEDSSPDFDRRLTDKGERQARDAGAALAALGIELEVCLASPRVRARDTATLACEVLATEVVIDDRLTGGSIDPLELTAGLAEVMLVGHEPDFSDAIAALTGARIDMKKGGIAGVENGALKVLLRPKETELIATVNGS